MTQLLFQYALRMILALALTFSSAMVSAVDSLVAAPFKPGTEGQLFQVQGSNTVGANLMKNLLIDYFRAKGVEGVAAQTLEVDNEYRVGGIVNGREVFVGVAAHGSSTGFKALQHDQADLSMSSRPIKMKEVSKLSHLGHMSGFDAEHVIAIDGLAVIVNDRNPVQKLDLNQIAKIFSGEIKNWQQLGGDDLAINLYARDNQSGTWDTFKSLVLRKKYQLASSARRFESNDNLSDSVAVDTAGIGFVGLASVRDARALLVFDSGTTPLLPGKISVATEDYVLSRRLFLYTPPSLMSPAIDDFLRFVQTDIGQQQVEATGFISQALIETKAEGFRQGPREYLEVTQGASRLSVNFRFAQGSATLDNKARQDIQRLVAYMAKPENNDKKITLVGFGDAKQTTTRAVVLSKLRAISVKSQLRKQGVSTQPVKGFGAYLPVASNTGKGKIKNRRVEVWVH